MTTDDLKARALARYAELHSIRGVSRELKIPRSTVQRWIQDAAKEGEVEPPIFDGYLKAMAAEPLPPPPKGKKRYFILTSAQNNTHVNEAFTRALESYAQHLESLSDTHDVRIMVSRFTYNMNRFGKKSVKPDKHPTQEDLSELWFDDWVEAHADDSYVEIAPGLLWCGHMNIMPTAVRPLSGLDTYGGRKSTIFPHVKIALQSVPTMRKNSTKLQYTTGSCTLRNYLQKKAGIKAEFHHEYAALIVEVNDEGDWFVRQLNADDDGSFYDLVFHVTPDGVTGGHPVLAINWGDIHNEIADPEPMSIAFDPGGMLDTLAAMYQFAHDILDFRPRNHHDRGNHHLAFEKFMHGMDNVEEEFINVHALLVNRMRRDWCKTVVVDSNHDRAFERWLREADYRFDPVNAIFFLRWQLFMYEAIRDGERPHIFEEVLRSYGGMDDVQFLRTDESLVLAGIEFGMHGDLGPNGARGSAQNLHKIGRKANIGHSHSAAIIDGLYQAGVMALNPDYAKGPSSWSHSSIITYQNGKRAIVTFWNGKWRA